MGKSAWMTRVAKSRLALRLIGTGDELSILLNDVWTRTRLTAPIVTNSATAVVKLAGDCVTVRSHSGYSQRILIVKMSSGEVIGTVEITAQGAIMCTTGRRRNVFGEWPELWKTQTTAVIGVAGGGALRLTDVIGQQDGVFTFSEQEKTWSIPSVFSTQTPHYDIPGWRYRNETTSNASRDFSSSRIESPTSSLDAEVAADDPEWVLAREWAGHANEGRTREATSVRERLMRPSGSRNDTATAEPPLNQSERASVTSVGQELVRAAPQTAVTQPREFVTSEDSVLAAVNHNEHLPTGTVVLINHRTGIMRRIQLVDASTTYAHMTAQGQYWVHIDGEWCHQCMGRTAASGEGN